MFGWFAFRSRVTGVYLSIITQALTYALLLAFFRNDMGFGGNNGLTDFKDILGFDVQSDAHARGAVLRLRHRARRSATSSPPPSSRSKFGKVIVGDPRRREPHALPRLPRRTLQAASIFTLSAMMAGVAGALYVPQVGIINPSEFAPANSIEAVIWVAVGGRGTLVGAALGAILVNFGKTYFTGAFPEYWLFVLGGLFVVVTLFLPQGHPRPHRPADGATRPSRRPNGRSRPKSRLPADGGVSRWTDRSPHLLAALSRRRPGLVRRLQGAARPLAGARARRDARHHRPERRRQDHHDGRHHRQDPARRGHVFFGGTADLTKLDEADIAELGIGRKFQKPTVFENHTVETTSCWR